MSKPYQIIPISECGEQLVAITSDICRIAPHPYMALGAPYGDRSPFFIRQGILEKLQKSQAYLQTLRPNWQIAVFDAYRPIPVQQFMVDYSFTQLAESKGLSIENLTKEQKESLMMEVIKFWAIPSDDPKTPPPHSTGAAIDVTLYRAPSQGEDSIQEINMGSPIDEISDRSLPDYFADSLDIKEREFHRDRQLLNQVMTHSGFQRHPNEWWHFSYGDQLWAWISNENSAMYGGVK
ncbi:MULTISPECIES: M15 family metallopeptidase [Pseudanabaena]|uniref:D-alanyl-D-alanine dipeptidase n=2 Tax=Pseudanabaena TaxID=1152 RepID=L8MW28_9CYAN|nr:MULTISPECIES: M15 family metallopeptidase [Pseudanabaena]ELS32167.1 D-Ala-D-Ala dipeptidase [Pseudanabaena biceps PCC 7429]MDG3495569.1 M15 family metallopeptidase [Pseudanabaena catenata USMAC16]